MMVGSVVGVDLWKWRVVDGFDINCNNIHFSCISDSNIGGFTIDFV